MRADQATEPISAVIRGKISVRMSIEAKTVAMDKNFARTIFVMVRGEERRSTSVPFFLSSGKDFIVSTGMRKRK